MMPGKQSLKTKPENKVGKQSQKMKSKMTSE
jgi:hypothetical protein